MGSAMNWILIKDTLIKFPELISIQKKQDRLVCHFQRAEPVSIHFETEKQIEECWQRIKELTSLDMKKAY